MSARWVCWLSLLVGVAVAGCGAPAGGVRKAAAVARPADVRPSLLEQRAMQLDLDEWVETLEAVHPNPYTRIGRDEFLAEVAAARAALPEHADALELYARLQRLSALLRDSHTLFHYPADCRGYRDPLWPVELIARDSRLFVGNRVAGLEKGTEIASVAGWSTERLLRAGSALTSAELDSAAQRSAPWSLPVVLWEAGERGPFMVRGRLASGAPVSALVAGVRPIEQEQTTSAEVEAFSLQWLEGDVALLVLRAMTDVDGFTRFMNDAAKALQQKHARGLIVDLRDNAGGNTDVGELLLRYVTSQPYRMISAKLWRVSRQYQAKVTWDDEYVKATPGTTLLSRFTATPPEPIENRYAGPVCFLIGPGTASAAMMLANAIEDFDLGTLIGEPTSSPPNYFGEVYSFRLSHTGLGAQASVAGFVRANGDISNPRPVLPDISIAQTPEQWLRGEDPALARALSFIKTSR